MTDARRVLSDESRTVTLPDGPHVLRFSMAAIDRIEAKYGTIQDAVEQVNQADGKRKFGPLNDLLCAASSPAVDREKVTLSDLNACLDVVLEVLQVDLGVEIETTPETPAVEVVQTPALNGGNGRPPFDEWATQVIPVGSQSTGAGSTTSPE